MRKLLLCVIVFLLFVCVLPVSAASSARITAAYGTIAVDGAAEDAWLAAEQQDVVLVDKEVIPSETKTTGKLRTMWDENYLYVLIEVDKHGVAVVTTKGGNENTDDCVELGITMNGDFTGSSNISGNVPYAGCLRVTADGTKGGFGALYNEVLDTFKGAMTVKDTAYTVEYAVPWQDIKPAEGHIVSMEVQINDNSGGGRDGLVNWASTPCYGWRDSLEHGAVVLGAISVPETESAETGVPAAAENIAEAPATADNAAAAVTLALSCAAIAIMRKRVK